MTVDAKNPYGRDDLADALEDLRRVGS